MLEKLIYHYLIFFDRMMSSLSMGDFISPSGSSISPVDSNGLRVSHEHTDSGLGADQDYAYSSERSSDSAKYTNKSSGASVASITTHSKSSHMSSIKSHHTVSSNSSHRQMKPPVCPNRHQTTNSNNSHNNSNKNALPAVHNSASYSLINNASSSSSSFNNSLHNNSQFKNNHYTFSLNRLSRYNNQLNTNSSNNNYTVGGGGFNNFNSTNFLDALPYHNPAACYHTTSSTLNTTDVRPRGTKSDIGVRISSISSQNTRRRHHHSNRSYHKFSSSNTTPNINEYATITNFNNNNNTLPSPNNNNSSYNSTTQFPSTTPQGSTIDYLENYKTASMQYYNSLSSSSRNHAGPLVYLDEKITTENKNGNYNYAVPVNVSNEKDIWHEN
uniref:CSON003599 protein n=1 Tax=Culicoides sonorensis TaxID=179676 RepID=A0A336MPB1_CULSO